MPVTALRLYKYQFLTPTCSSGYEIHVGGVHVVDYGF